MLLRKILTHSNIYTKIHLFFALWSLMARNYERVSVLLNCDAKHEKFIRRRHRARHDLQLNKWKKK